MLTNCIISRPFRDITDSQIVFLSPDLVLIEYSDPGAQDVKMSTNTFAMLKLEGSTVRYQCFIFATVHPTIKTEGLFSYRFDDFI